MRFFLAFILIAMTAGLSNAEHLWVNNITVDEYNMTWNYTETFTAMDSVMYRISIDKGLGNNDSFINAWELLNADKDVRKTLRKSIDIEPDVRIDDKTTGIEVIDLDSMLSPDLIGKTHSTDTAANKYRVSYTFQDSIFNASSVWFLGQANTSVNIVMPAGIDVTNISGMYNITKNITDHTEIKGFFRGTSAVRGEINLNLSKNLSFQVPKINITSPAVANNTTVDNATMPLTDTLFKIRDISIVGAGIVIILLVYIFKMKIKFE